MGSKIKYQNAEKVFNCCGKYIAVDKAVKDEIRCPICGTVLRAPLQVPRICMVTKK